MPQVTLREVETAENSLTFELKPVDASRAVYRIVEAGETEPSVDELFEEGIEADPSQTKSYTAKELRSDTEYLILAAASNEYGRSKEIARLTMKTLSIEPGLRIESGSTDLHSIRFTLTPADADRVAYLCVKKGETVPSAAEILEKGTEADPSAKKEYAIDRLESNTAYVVAAAAAHGEHLTEAVTTELATTRIDPQLTLQSVEVTSSAIRFSITPNRAEKVAYVCYAASETAPDAERILSEGTEADASQYQTYLVENLLPGTDYVIAAVAGAGNEISQIATLEAATLQPVPPAMGDFYYSDGTWSSGAADPLPEKTCIGVVFYAGRCELDAVDDCVYTLKDGTTPLEEVRGYVIALRNASEGAAWGSFETDATGGAGTSFDKSDFRGYSNTQSIRNKAIEKAGGLSDDAENNYPACYYATAAYEEQVPAPESSTGWFMPSAYQLMYIYPHYETINAAFDKLGQPENYVYQRDAQYWSSTEEQKANGQMYWAYYVSLDSSMIRPGFISSYRKSSDLFKVRSILVF